MKPNQDSIVWQENKTMLDKYVIIFYVLSVLLSEK